MYNLCGSCRDSFSAIRWRWLQSEPTEQARISVRLEIPLSEDFVFHSIIFHGYPDPTAADLASEPNYVPEWAEPIERRKP